MLEAATLGAGGCSPRCWTLSDEQACRFGQQPPTRTLNPDPDPDPTPNPNPHQVGLFGQEAPWQLDKRETWLDRSRCNPNPIPEPTPKGPEPTPMVTFNPNPNSTHNPRFALHRRLRE